MTWAQGILNVAWERRQTDTFDPDTFTREIGLTRPGSGRGVVFSANRQILGDGLHKATQH